MQAGYCWAELLMKDEKAEEGKNQLYAVQGIGKHWPILQKDMCQTQNTETHSLAWKKSNRKLHLFRGTRPLVYAWAGPRAALGPLPCLMSCWEMPPDLHELQQEQLLTQNPSHNLCSQP